MTYDRVIEKFGLYFAEIGLNKTCGRLFGIFMTAAEPLSMGELVTLLQISKSTASTELRRLLSMRMVEKALLPDKRADYYQLRENLWAVNLRQKIEDIRKLQSIVAEIAPPDLAKLEHLQAMADYCSFLAPELEALVKKYMEREPLSGLYRTEEWIVEWTKCPALSETFASKMASLAKLGIDAFAPVEQEFLSIYPQAIEEDRHLSGFRELQGVALDSAIRAKLEAIFCMDPKIWSREMREGLAHVYYYVVTIREVGSLQTDGFAVFMAMPKGEFKITVLAVDDRIRRRGAAGILVDSFRKIGVSYTKLLASTRPSNTFAIQAYKKWGFTEDAEATPAHFISGHWVHLMRKETYASK
jgi:DNA-binding transcriptional regulator GbsR (MarR family)/ribosomal protein S18 acetylase RimI-like enzyme